METNNITIPVDGKTPGNIRETLLIERHFDRILNLTCSNLMDFDNRNMLKSSIEGLEAYLADILEHDKTYQENAAKIKDGLKGNMQAEIDKSFRLIQELKKAISRSPLSAPEVIDIDSSDDEN